MRENFRGFTLAEVLITLTIIGVVAALTVPNLYAYYQKTQYVTQLKKIYTEISQALKLMMADESINKITASDTLYCDETAGCIWDEAYQRAGNDFLKKYFKVIKDCGRENLSTCFADNYKSISGNEAGGIGCYYSVIIASGASICISGQSGTYNAGTFIVDINGLKLPNVAGRDLFTFSYYYDGSLDESITPECRKGIANASGLCSNYGSNAQEAREEYFNNGRGGQPGCLGNSYSAIGCFGKILNDNWKMDY
ncbi:MAG TPA: type II secretion system protein [Candidatus Gastranaerophilaceae bacterium]|nr:type II secretion system protein [Candidatus Gastranaerophilaceae bacterium]